MVSEVLKVLAGHKVHSVADTVLEVLMILPGIF